MQQLLVFSLDGNAYGLPLSCVQGVYRAAEPRPLPDAPPLLLGLLNLHGEVLPVYDTRRRLQVPAKPLALTDALVLVQASERRLLLLVDEVGELQPYDTKELQPPATLPRPHALVAAVLPVAGGLIMLCDPATLLPPVEAMWHDQTLPVLEADHVAPD